LTSFDNEIVAALIAFSQLVKQAGRDSFQDFVSTQKAEMRRRQLLQIAKDAEALAKQPATATYQAFERLLGKAQSSAPKYLGKR
jgi:histone H3/H4